MRVLLASLLCACCLGFAAEDATPAAKPAAAKAYPLEKCLLMDEKVDLSIPAEVYKGQEFRFCCKGCIRRFKKDPEKYLKMLEEEVAKPKPTEGKSEGK